MRMPFPTLAATLVEALRLPSTSFPPRAREYIARIAPEFALETLQRRIEGNGAGQQTLQAGRLVRTWERDEAAELSWKSRYNGKRRLKLSARIFRARDGSAKRRDHKCSFPSIWRIFQDFTAGIAGRPGIPGASKPATSSHCSIFSERAPVGALLRRGRGIRHSLFCSQSRSAWCPLRPTPLCSSGSSHIVTSTGLRTIHWSASFRITVGSAKDRHRSAG